MSDSPVTAVVASAVAMTAIVGLRYLLTSGLFAWITSRVRPGLYRNLGPQMGREVRWSLLSAAIYGIPAGVVAWGWQARGWTRIYTDAGDYPWWWLPASLFVFLFLHDTWFYWTHRWAAMSFHPIEALTGAVVVPALVFLVPIHVAVLGTVLLIMTVMGITNHMGWEMFPKRLIHSRAGHWLITASHHSRHHEFYRCNYGLYFRFWDHWCGTDRGIAAP
jgi:sterol desaturase/sphingolipid hydroxylase (fatty acid hydroxylase superfamily)